MEDFDLGKYIYWEYSLSVLIFTELARVLLKKINTRFVQIITIEQPKWVTLFVAVSLAAIDWLVFGNGKEFHFYQFIISFGCAVLGYDYVVKLVKDQFKKQA